MKIDLALNNIQRLIRHKIQPANQRNSQLKLQHTYTDKLFNLQKIY